MSNSQGTVIVEYPHVGEIIILSSGQQGWIGGGAEIGLCPSDLISSNKLAG